MKKLFFLATSMIFSMMNLYCQTEVDALRYSGRGVISTARGTGMGGAFGALGGDMSSISINPAGMSVYNSSNFCMSAAYNTSVVSSSFLGNKEDDIKYNFNIPCLGYLYNYKVPDRIGDEKWKNVNFGFVYNRTNSFNNRILTKGVNNSSSILTEWLGKAQGNTPELLQQMYPYDVYMAYNTFLLDTVGSLINYESLISSPYGITQYKSIEQKGNMSDLSFSISGNYDDKLYLGGSMSVNFISYKETGDYSEEDVKNKINDFKYFTIHDNLTTTGSGFNFKLGLIYRLEDWLRIGGAVHFPTFYAMTDDFNRTMQSYFDDGSVSDKMKSSGSSIDYNYNTAAQYVGSLAFVIKKDAIISFDYEYINHSQSRFRSDDYDYVGVNNAIRDSYTGQHIFHGGIEYNLSPVSLRAGYIHYTSPYLSGINDKWERNTYSFGMGLRDKKINIDASYFINIGKESYYLYSPSILKEPANNNYKQGTLTLTVTYKID